jgi:hypothetical protein
MSTPDDVDVKLDVRPFLAVASLFLLVLSVWAL